MNKKEILVVGRGIMGLFSALRLSEAGHKVTLMGEKPGTEVASGAALGLVSVKGLKLARDPLFKEKLRGHARMKELIRELQKSAGMEIPHEFKGVKECFPDPRAYTRLRERIYHGEFTGCFSVHLLNRRRLLEESEFIRRQAGAGMRVFGAFSYPEDGWFDPGKFLECLEISVIKNGAFIMENSIKSVFKNRRNKISAYTKNNSDQISFDEMVLALGSGLPEFIKEIWGKNLPFKFTPGVTVSWKNEKSFEKSEAFRFGRYGIRITKDRFFLGSEDIKNSVAPGEEELSKSRETLEQVGAREFSLSFSPGRFPEIRTGVRLSTRDRAPVLGTLPIGDKKVWIAGALYKNGYDLAPGMAQTLCQRIAKGESYPDLTAG